MAKKKEESKKEYYFEIKEEEFFPSGCAVLDGVLGHGWVNKHVTNIIGPSKTGKSLLALEAVINYRNTFPDSKCRFADNEVALNKSLLIEVGFPIADVEFVRLRTIEEFFNNFDEFRTSLEPGQHGIYVCDSLDSLSDDAEREREITDNTFGALKAKKANEIMRRIIADVESSNISLFILSQEKVKIGVVYGSKRTRACETPLEFFSAHILWLKQKKDIDVMHGGISRPIGAITNVYCDKNRVGRRGRECLLQIMFERGIDDIRSNLNFLEDAKALDRVPKIGDLDASDIDKYAKKVWSLSSDEFNKYRQEIADVTKVTWEEVEHSFDPSPNKRY
jgi:RecA/RadA recombinase